MREALSNTNVILLPMKVGTRKICVRFTMLSSMHNDLIDEFEQYITTQDMWKALKLRYGGTSATRLRGLTMKFDSYKMRSEHMMK